MGQYYKFMNIDKKQNCQRNWHGIKLMEHSYVGNYYCDDILRLLSNEWKGDRVIHVGDYAEPNDETVTQNIVEKIIKEYDVKCSLYQWCDMFDEVEPSSNEDIRYVYNLDKKEYVDLYNQPAQWFHYHKDSGIGPVKINSFALLIGCGNGLGGGDYWYINGKNVGAWAGDKLVSSKEQLKEYSKFKCRDEIYNEIKESYKKIKKFNRFTKDKILKEEKDMFIKYIEYLKEHDVDITEMSLDNCGLLEEEKKIFGDILEKEKSLAKNNKVKEEDICL